MGSVWNATRSHLKKRILVQVRGGAEFKTAGILTYFEDFKPGTNKEIGLKDFFEITSMYLHEVVVIVKYL
jgi:hypothetical protein